MANKRQRDLPCRCIGTGFVLQDRFTGAKHSARQRRRLQVPAFGLKRDVAGSDDIGPLRLQISPQTHISSKGVVLEMKGCGNAELVLHWYKLLNPSVRGKIDSAGFNHLIQKLNPRYISSCLFQGLAEKWWDTTHTFHFEKIGEMTMTPKDFSCITGLPVGGRGLLLDRKLYRKSHNLRTLLGESITSWRCPTIPVRWLYETYRDIKCTDSETEDIVVRAFLLVLFGAVLFSRPSNRVHLHYLASLSQVEEIGRFNWGGAALAYQYLQMDDICRCHTNEIGGIWASWEIWALEYIPTLRAEYNMANKSNYLPTFGDWLKDPRASVDVGTEMRSYRRRFMDIHCNEVIWHPWPNENNLPSYVKRSLNTNQRRIFLMSPFGGAWYLPERVTIQSMGVSKHLIPKRPPTSMLTTARVVIPEAQQALRGQSVLHFIENETDLTYNAYRGVALSTDKTDCNIPRIGQSSETAIEEEELPIPTWTIFVPSTHGSPRIVRIPTDVDMPTVEIPPHIQQVSTRTANRLLRMVAGMQYLLTQFAQDHRFDMINSVERIERLRYQLGSVMRHHAANINEDPINPSLRTEEVEMANTISQEEDFYP